MWLGTRVLGDNLTFTAATHTPATSADVDADAVPSYRLYENETTSPILTGNMAKLDDSNTTGFYSETIALTVANGFERGKSYTIKIVGVVGTVTSSIPYHFSIKLEDVLYSDAE